MDIFDYLTPTKLVGSCMQGAICAVRFTVNGENVLTCGVDKTIKLWNVENANFKSAYQGHTDKILDARGNPDNSKLASGGLDKKIFLWDVETCQAIQKWEAHKSAVSAIQFNSNSDCIVSGSQDNTVKLWDPLAPTEIMCLEDATDTISSISVVNHNILVGSTDTFTRLYDLRKGNVSDFCMNEAVTSVLISKDMTCHLISVADETVKLIDEESGGLLAFFGGHSEPQYKYHKIEVAFDSSDSYVLAASPKGKVFVWDLTSTEVRGVLIINEANTLPVTSISAHPQRPLVAASVDGGLFFFDLTNDPWEKPHLVETVEEMFSGI